MGVAVGLLLASEYDMKHYCLSKTASLQLKAVLDQFEAQGAKVTGGPDNFYTACPAHDDHASSLSIADGDTGVMLKCHAGCEQDDLFTAAVLFTGLAKSDFFFDGKSSSKIAGPPVTIAELAAAKKLPVELLANAGMRDSSAGIQVPYWDGPMPPRVRIRHTLKAKGSSWLPPPRPGHSITAYGAWLVPHFRAGRALYLVEGETDTLTGMLYGLPVIGVPGKTLARSVIARNPHLTAGFDFIFLIEEPDDYVQRKFLEGVRRGLSEIHSLAVVYPMRLPEKDLSDLHVNLGPSGFWPALQSAWAAAVDAPFWPDPLPVPPAAAEVCATIQSPKVADVFTFRDLRRRLRHLDGAKVRHDVELLEKANILRRLPPTRVVGRPSEFLRRNPKLVLNS